MKTTALEGVEISKNPSPEQYLIDILNQLTGKLFQGKQVWSIGDQWIFEVDYESKILWCYYYKVWEIFEREDQMTYEEIQQLMQTVVCKALNLEGFTPHDLRFYYEPTVCKALNLEDFAPA